MYRNSKILIFFLFILAFGGAQAFPAYTIFTINGKQGLKDDEGKIIIPAEYDALGWSFSSEGVKNGRIGFNKEGQWGVLDLNGNTIFPASLEAVFDATPNVIIAGKKQVNGRYKRGAFNYDGEQILPYDYNYLKAYDSRILARKGETYGLLNFNNRMVIPFNYSHLEYLNNQRWFGKNKSGEGVLFNNEGLKLTAAKIDHISNFKEGVAIASSAHFKGVLDKNGSWILEPKYKNIEINSKEITGTPYLRFSYHSNPSEVQWLADSIRLINDSLFVIFGSGQVWVEDLQKNNLLSQQKKIYVDKDKAITISDGRMGLFDLSLGEYLLDESYKDIKLAGNHLALVKKYINYDLIKLPSKKSLESGIESFRFFNDHLLIKKRGKMGVYSLGGDELLTPVFDLVKKFAENKFIVTYHGDDGIIDQDQNWLVIPGQEEILDLNDFIYITKSGKISYVNDYNSKRIYFSEYPLKLQNEYVVEQMPGGIARRVNFEGLSISSAFKDTDYVEVLPISEGLIGVYRNNLYGFTDPEGRLLISNRYSGIQKFKNGKASVKINGKWGVIDKRERILIQPQHDSIGYFNDNKVAIFRNDAHYGLINDAADILLKPEYDSIYHSNGNFYIIKNNEVGVATNSGKVLIWPRYTSIIKSFDSFLVEKKGLFGLLDNKGVPILPPNYDQIIPLKNTSDYIIGIKQKNTTIELN